MSVHGGDATLIVLGVSILVGGLAIHVGSMLAATSEDYEHATVTAVLGGVAWALVDWAFSEVDALAEVGLPGRVTSVVALLVWVWVVRWRYSVGWFRAGLIGLVGWIAALVTLAVLSALGIGGLEAYGVPGT